jgi:hypothetical protein
MSACEFCGTESPLKYEWTGFNRSPLEQRGWRIVCWHARGDDSDVVVLHEESTCRDVLRSQVAALHLEIRALRAVISREPGR